MAVSLQFDQAAASGIRTPGRAVDFDEIYRTQVERVRTLLRRRLRDANVVDDVTQETFLRAYRSLDRFEPGRPVWPWLKAIALNCSVDAMRRRTTSRAEETTHLDEAEDVVDFAADPHVNFSLTERQQGLRDAMATLSARQRRVLALTDVDGWDVRQVAEIEGTTPDSVKSVLKRGRAAFRRVYLTIAEERGLLAGAPLLGRALVHARSMRDRAGRRLGAAPLRVFNSAVPYLTDAAVAAVLSGALVYGGAGSAALAHSPSRVQSAVLAGASTAAASSLGAAPSASTAHPATNGPFSAGASLQSNGPSHSVVQARHTHEGRGGTIRIEFLSKVGGPGQDYATIQYDCEKSVVSTTFCDVVDALPNQS